jgi:hypothetical protein
VLAQDRPADAAYLPDRTGNKINIMVQVLQCRHASGVSGFGNLIQGQEKDENEENNFSLCMKF